MPLLTFVAGALVPPVMQTLRAAWPRVVHGPALRTAYAVDATAQELLFIVGPMLGATAVSVASPRLGVLLAAAMSAAFIWWYALQQPAPLDHDDASGPRLTARRQLWHRHRLPLILSFGLWVMAFNGISLGIVAFADQHGERLIAGILEAVWAFGSLVGGAVAGCVAGDVRRTCGGGRLWSRWDAVVCVRDLVTGGARCRADCVRLDAGAGDRCLVRAPWRARPGHRAHRGLRLDGERGNGRAAIGSAVSGAVVESFGVRYVWLVATVLAAGALVLLLRVPPPAPHRQHDHRVSWRPARRGCVAGRPSRWGCRRRTRRAGHGNVGARVGAALDRVHRDTTVDLDQRSTHACRGAGGSGGSSARTSRNFGRRTRVRRS